MYWHSTSILQDLLSHLKKINKVFGLLIFPPRALLSKVGNEINNITTSSGSKGQPGPGTGLWKNRWTIGEQPKYKDNLFCHHQAPFSACFQPYTGEDLSRPENTALLPLSGELSPFSENKEAGAASRRHLPLSGSVPGLLETPRGPRN